MMKLEKRSSGLVVPKNPPPPPSSYYGPLELRDDEERAAAKKALLLLWDAMNLSRTGGVGLPHPGGHDAYRRLYRFVGEMLLGAECPEKEILT